MNTQEQMAVDAKRIAELEKENKVLRYLRTKIKDRLLSRRCELRDMMNEVEDYIYDLGYGKPPLASMSEKEREILFEPVDELSTIQDTIR